MSLLNLSSMQTPPVPVATPSGHGLQNLHQSAQSCWDAGQRGCPFGDAVWELARQPTMETVFVLMHLGLH